jgi:ABC-type dipeptide/oligopeptide/nickel transport system ATPase subunit
MPKFTHKLEVDYQQSFRSACIEGMFDVPVEKKLSKSWDIDIPIENEEWSIGLIVGPSGCGKTTVGKAAFPEAKLFDGSRHDNWNANCFVDDFAKELQVQEIVEALSKVGFSSPPSWVLPFSVLSNGQKFRTEIARLILESKEGETIMIDEFTSVVDRTVAKVCSSAVQKMIRSTNRKMVAISCHYDIAEWLEPDWIYHVDTGEFKITRGLLKRPAIELVIRRVHHSAWGIFKNHHYLDASVNKSAHCFVAFLDGQPVAFCAAIPFPHPKLKNMWRAHRTVCLPDYQGVGIGNAFSEAIAQHFIDQGKRYSSVTSHPSMIAHRIRSKKWAMTRKPGRVPVNGKTGIFKSSANRVTASFEYIGDKSESSSV